MKFKNASASVIVAGMFSVGLAIVAACSSGTSTTVPVEAGINCGDGSQVCGNTCTVLARDVENCGSCGKKCAAGEVCSQGACAANCGGGTTKCGTACADTKTDGSNCGTCGTKCGAGQVCNAGVCANGCGGGSTVCGNSCVNTQTDQVNCGACGTICANGEQCVAGKCQISCQAGLTLCTPPQSDGGVSDAASDVSVADASNDGGPVLGTTYCANLKSDNSNCGACGKTCGAGQACVNAACVNVGLIGTGTDPDPYRFAIGSQQISCKAIKAAIPTAVDGIYLTRPSSSDIKVYCDMTNGAWTYEAFGFGRYNLAYAGWTFVGGPDFTGSAQFRAAFEYLYNREAGLINIVPGGTSSNCCFMNTTNTNWYAFLGGTYMYPANGSNNAVNCNGTYSDAKMKIYLVTQGVTKSSFTQPELANVAYSSSCGVGNNPAIFAKRYQ